MTVKVYNSANYATKFTGTAGSGLAVLDIILLGSGWTKPFTGTNINVYRNGAGSRQSYFRFDDSGSTTALTRNMKIRGYTTMTDSTDAGTNPFPTTTQSAQGYFIRKSTTADTVNREWFAVVDELVCYLFIYSEGAGNPVLYAFGDFQSDSSTDIYQSFISCQSTDTTVVNIAGTGFDTSGFSTNITTNTKAGCVLAGTHPIGGSSTAVATLFNKHLSIFSTVGTTLLSNPESITGGVGQLVLSPLYIHYNNGTANYVRGIHQGLWFWYTEYQALSINGQSEYDGFYVKNTLTNKLFKIFKITTTVNIAVEISDTWYT